MQPPTLSTPADSTETVGALLMTPAKPVVFQHKVTILQPGDERYEKIKQVFNHTLIQRKALPPSYVFLDSGGQKMLHVQEEDSILKLDAASLIQDIPLKESRHVKGDEGTDLLIQYTRQEFWPINSILRGHSWKVAREQSVMAQDTHAFATQYLPKAISLYQQLNSRKDTPEEGILLYRYFSNVRLP